MPALGFRVFRGLGFRLYVLGFTSLVSGFEVSLGFRVSGFKAC